MKFYRFEAIERGEAKIIPDPHLILRLLYLVKETPKGYWIAMGDPNRLHVAFKKWVSKTAKKRYAYPTEEEALNSFILKKKRQIKILKYMLARAQADLSIGIEHKE